MSELDKIEKSYEAEKNKLRSTAAKSPQVSVRLSMPVKINGIEVEEIKMRRPTANDLIEVQEMDGSDAIKERALIARLAGAPPEEVGECDAADWGLLQAALEGFPSGRVSRKRS